MNLQFDCISCGVKKVYVKINKFVKQQVCSKCMNDPTKAFNLKNDLENYKESDKMYAYWCLDHRMRLKNQSCSRCKFTDNYYRIIVSSTDQIVPYIPTIHNDEHKRREKYIKEIEDKYHK
jgi:hypothetical protein